jgi:hypothetical protein
MRITALLLSVSIFVFTPLVSSALELGGESRTYLQSRETLDSNRLTPLYEYLDFTIQDMGSDYVSFHFGGWLRYKDDSDQAFSKRLNGDLQYAYMSYKKGTLQQPQAHAGNILDRLQELFHLCNGERLQFPEHHCRSQ